jgi:dienelactone hydrolase
LSIKIYLQEPANSTNRKGIVVVGSGNNEFAPTPGSLTGALENALCQKLANEGYIAAIVQYVVPAVASNYSNWNAVGVAMATDYNKAFNGIITKYGGSRNTCIAAGVSFTTFLLLTNIAYYNDLADIKGFMGACGGTGTDQANNFKIPIASISCQNDYDAMYNINGEDLVNAIANPTIKSMSRGLRDQTCSGHCNGDTNTWVNWLTDSVKLWLP